MSREPEKQKQSVGTKERKTEEETRKYICPSCGMKKEARSSEPPPKCCGIEMIEMMKDAHGGCCGKNSKS
ncbi:hypothetical protein HRbin19_01252 [bacterium HR19]|nr:hypothetical protein HRbin19_01252 [bacterium HR19]